MRKPIILFILFFLISSCCKEEVEINEFPSLFGYWDITQIDSCVTLLAPPYGLPRIISNFQETGSIFFNEDSTGFINDSIRSITCGETNFSWEYNKIYSKIYLTFSNGITDCFITTFKKDTIELYLRNYCKPDPYYVMLYYYMKLVKTK